MSRLCIHNRGERCILRACAESRSCFRRSLHWPERPRSGLLGGGWSVAAAPRIVFLDTDPVSVRGTNFKSAERVQVEVVAGSKTMTRSTTGSPTGAFTMRMAGIDPNACQGFSVTATGNKGSRATFKRAPGQCPDPG